ncbi:porin [Algiphilus sp.]|uniref:porin n=1 Tax=Algiphilus sp. TaxID=1872431 RepID=UPI0025C2993A|nr:porin [Algiphilus sp.]MCK5769867.1 hypothetical protein [Algiphilus sp.]
MTGRDSARALGAGVAMALAATAAHGTDDAGWKPMGFAQLTMEQRGDGGIDFGADRVRAGARFSAGDFGGGLVLDFNVPDAGDRTPGTLTNVIKDVYGDWRFHSRWLLRVGQFKTPLGMDFNTPGHRLDITKRGMEKPLVLERDPGAMVSGRGLPGGFGVDAGAFNPAGRSGATTHTTAQEGEDNAYAGRLHWDGVEALHAEIAYGTSEAAGGPGTEDYRVLDAGLRFTRGPLTLKAEWIDGSDIRGIDGRDERVVYGHADYRLSQRWTLVARHYAGRSEPATGGDSNLGNTYLGVTVHPPMRGPVVLRLQINAVLESGDGEAYTGLGGFRDDAVLVQAQVALR